MLARGQDSPLLRYGLGLEYWKAGDPQQAIERLALQHNPNHSASWKVYGRALVGAGRRADALAAFARGIGIAERQGDLQAAKEMRAFHRRVKKREQGRER
jgi:predicted Zn-dependent protease